MVLKYLLSLVFILLSVAFFTLLERKVLGYSHNRFGPNKIGILGLLQPFTDALKLFSKEDFKQKEMSFYIYVFSPMLGLFLSLVLWSFMGFWGLVFYSNFSFVIFICLSSLSVYFLLFSGWSSSGKYSLLGSYRSSAQSISYEVIMILCFLFFCYCNFCLSFSFLMSVSFSLFNLGLIVLICWLVSCLAEANRSPFDFSEGESELVSGFNTEYLGGFFSIIFISEYSSIIFLSFLSGMLFFYSINCFFYSIFVCFFYLWVRSSFPRLRYDFLMMSAWKGYMVFMLGPLICLMGIF